jgi:N-carbamoyl-L-amino-acid hydrolase
MPSVNAERLLRDLRSLRRFGGAERHSLGVIRPSLSAEDMAARNWLLDRFEDAGLERSLDGVGVAFGRSPNPGPALLVGSHSDTQPRGGWLDGAMGVIFGLECARALAEDPATAHFAVDVASWTDEESTYLGMVGSKSFCGLLPPGAVDAARSEVGVRDEQGLVKIAPQEPLLDALARAGLAGRDTLTMEPGRYVGFFEAHIEQGPSLEASGNQIGVGERVYLPC